MGCSRLPCHFHRYQELEQKALAAAAAGGARGGGGADVMVALGPNGVVVSSEVVMHEGAVAVVTAFMGLFRWEAMPVALCSASLIGIGHPLAMCARRCAASNGRQSHWLPRVLRHVAMVLRFSCQALHVA